MKYWRIKDLAANLGVSKSWVYKRTSRGEIPCVYMGAIILFDPREIEKWVSKQPTMRKKRSD